MLEIRGSDVLAEAGSTGSLGWPQSVVGFQRRWPQWSVGAQLVTRTGRGLCLHAPDWPLSAVPTPSSRRAVSLFHDRPDLAKCGVGTAWRRRASRVVEHRSSRRGRQDSRVAMALCHEGVVLRVGPVHRSLAGRRRPPTARGTGCRPRRRGYLAGPARDVGLGESIGDAVSSGRADVVDGAGRSRCGPRRPVEGAREDLHVQAVSLCSPRRRAGQRRSGRSAAGRRPAPRTPSTRLFAWSPQGPVPQAPEADCQLGVGGCIARMC